jgi:hypothetical protein
MREGLGPGRGRGLGVGGLRGRGWPGYTLTHTCASVPPSPLGLVHPTEVCGGKPTVSIACRGGGGRGGGAERITPQHAAAGHPHDGRHMCVGVGRRDVPPSRAPYRQ